MQIIFFVFYAIVVVTIIVNVLKIVRAFKGNIGMFENLQNMVDERYEREMQNNTFEANKTNNVEKDANLDDFMKSNTNPIKEVKGKRSKI